MWPDGLIRQVTSHTQWDKCESENGDSNDVMEKIKLVIPIQLYNQ